MSPASKHPNIIVNYNGNKYIPEAGIMTVTAERVRQLRGPAGGAGRRSSPCGSSGVGSRSSPNSAAHVGSRGSRPQGLSRLQGRWGRGLLRRRDRVGVAPKLTLVGDSRVQCLTRGLLAGGHPGSPPARRLHPLASSGQRGRRALEGTSAALLEAGLRSPSLARVSHVAVTTGRLGPPRATQGSIWQGPHLR